jgi:hypothetical protein
MTKNFLFNNKQRVMGQVAKVYKGKEYKAVNQAVESRLARAKNVHQAITGGVPSKPGFAPSERKQHGEGIGPSEKLQGMGRKRAEAKDYSKYQSAQPKTEAPAFGPKNKGRGSQYPKEMGHSFDPHFEEYLETQKQSDIKESAKKADKAKNYAKEQSALPKTEAPAFGPRKQSASSSGPYNKSKEEISKANDAIKVKKAQDYAKQQSSKPKTEAPAFGPRNTGLNVESKDKSGGMGSRLGVTATDPMAAKMGASAKNFSGPTASQKVIAGMSEAGRQAKEKKQKKMSALGKSVAAKVKAASAAGKEKHDQKPGLNPMDYKGASMFKHLKHAFSDKGPIGKAVNKVTGKYDKGFEKVVAPIEKGIKSGVSGVATGAKKFGSAVKKVATSPTTAGLAKATAVHAGMALMHGTNYPRVMAQHAAQGPREFKPGWHGFTSPVERPKAEEGTDTKGERG